MKCKWEQDEFCVNAGSESNKLEGTIVEVGNYIEKITVVRDKALYDAVLIGVQQIATEHGIDTKVYLNEEAIVEAFKDYQNKHKRKECSDKKNKKIHCESCHEECKGG